MAEPERRQGAPDATTPVNRRLSPDGAGRAEERAEAIGAAGAAGHNGEYRTRQVDVAGAGSPLRRHRVLGFLLALGTLAVVFVLAFWRGGQESPHARGVPPRVDGLLLDHRPAVGHDVDQLREALATGVPLRSATGAAYTANGAPADPVIFVWGEGSFPSPEASLDAAFAVIVGDDIDLEDSRPLLGGSGGVVKCGVYPAAAATASICGWAEDTTLGIGLFPDRSAAESVELLHGMRRDINIEG